MIHLNSLPENLKPFVKPRSFEANFDLQGLSVAVSVQVPDLSDCPGSVWGDWGPIYRLDLTPDQRIRILYRCSSEGVEASYELSPPTLGLRSPMLAVERHQTPFYLDIVDAARNLRLKAYLDSTGQYVRLVAELLHSGLDAKALVFPELRQRRAVVLSSPPSDQAWRKAG